MSADEHDLQASDQDPSGAMGVSSERRGDAGPGQFAPTGTRDTSPPAPTDADAPPEQSATSTEPDVHPDPPVPPVSGWSSQDPRSG